MSEHRSGRSLIAFTFFLVLLACLAYVVRTALLLMFVAIIFAVVFSPWVNWIQRWRVRSWSPSRGAAVLILLAMVLAAVGIFLGFAVPPIARDASRLVRDLPQNVESLQQRVSALPFGRALGERINPESVRAGLQTVVRHGFSMFQGVAHGVLVLITLAVLTAYFILDGRRAFNWAMSLVPLHSRERLAETLERSEARAQRWLYGQMLLMLILGSASAVVFGLLGIRYFYALAVFAGLANFVPILGPFATVLVASAVAALDSWTRVLGVLAFYFVYQQVENAFLTPRIMRSAVGLPGIAIIVALTIGGELAGLLGAIIAVPTAAILATVIDEYLVRRHTAPALQKTEAA